MNSYDIRVVRLIKSTQANPLSSYLTGAENIWMCLGHFDVAVIDELPLQSDWTPLQAVQNDSIQLWTPSLLSGRSISYSNAIENNYIYPLYAIKQLTECSGKEQNSKDFWNIESNFLAVTRLHCDREKNEVSEHSFSKMLQKRLQEMCKAAWMADTDGDYLTLSLKEVPLSNVHSLCVSVSFYDSLELGDVIGFIKCNSISTILQIQQILYESPCVSDAYTYCGIHNRLFLPKSFTFDDELLKQRSLEYFSTRFSVKCAKYADEAYSILLNGDHTKSTQTQHFFVVGNADTVIDWRGCSEWVFLKQMRKIIQLYSTKDKPYLMYEAFADTVTRIGLKYKAPDNSRPCNFQKVKKTDEIRCPDIVQEALIESNSAAQWHYPLVKLLGTLQTMSKNSVMDDLSTLLIPGVNALLNRIEDLLEKRRTIDSISLLSFLDSCTALINDILHIENQLDQHPELMPVRYFIPAIVLGFEQKFIRECARQIDVLDYPSAPSKDCGFEPIIFPSCETNTSTRCFFDHKLDDDYSGKVPLAIYVPIPQLYRPWEVLHTLCHEIAHYCGDERRNRRERYDCIVRSSAVYILQRWANCYRSVNNEAQGTIIEVQRTIIDKMAPNIERKISKKYSINSKSANSDFYLASLNRYLPACVVEVAGSRELQEQFLYCLLDSSNTETQIDIVAGLDTNNSANKIGGLQLFFQKHLVGCLTSHYKECYADIIMILFLNCTFDDYYECVYENECLSFLANNGMPANKNDEAMWEYHSDRLALVILSIEGVKGYEAWSEKSTGIKKRPGGKWAEIALEKVGKWKDRDPKNPEWHRKYLRNSPLPNPYELHTYEVVELEKYLLDCANQVVVNIRSNQEILQLRNRLGKLKADQFDWNSLKEYLEQ